MADAGSPSRAEATAPPDRWRIRGGHLGLGRPLVMGILNVTPDSFSDGGRYLDPGAAAERAARMIEEGADLVDVGGESTRPGAKPVPAEEEWRRVGPVLERLAAGSDPVVVSVDTTKGEVARRALDAGASIVNDVSGLRFDRSIAEMAARTGAGLVVMHMRGDPSTMQADVAYDDLVGEVRDRLRESVEVAVQSGCDPEQVVVDPGIGFGKSAEGNLELLARLDRLLPLGRPILVGPSRKSFLGALLDLPPEERVEGTLAACVVALTRGARIFRVHDVAPARRALDVAEAIRRRGDGRG